MMKNVIFLLAFAAGASSMYAESAKTKKAKTAAVAPAPQVPVVQIPAGAVRTTDGYRAVDAKGVAWIYRETPFGVTRAKEEAVVAQHATTIDPDASITARQEGDLIHFERPGPFGLTKWDKNVNALTPDEQKIWQRINTQRAQ